MTLAKDSQATISLKLFSHSKPQGPMIREMLGLFDMMTPYLTLSDMEAILFSKQGQNYFQATFPSNLHFV